MPKTQRSLGQEIIDSLSEFKAVLASGEPIASKFTVRRIELDLKLRKYKARDVRATRELLDASQAIFAQFLGVSVQTVRAWEQGDKTPRDVASRFMDEIRRDPEYWRKRLVSLAHVKRAVG